MSSTEFWKNPEYYRHALGLEETKEGVRPYRFTEAQLAVYNRTENHGQRSRCQAGVCLAFDTDSQWIEIDAFIYESARNYVYAQLAIDDRWESSAGTSKLGPLPTRHTFRFELPHLQKKEEAGAEQRIVKVYLPHLANLAISAVRLSPGATILPSKNPALTRRLLCLGDSITQGAAAVNPAAVYPVRLATLLGTDLLNQGVGGYIFAPESFDPALPYDADLITIAYGTNDWSRGTSAEDIAESTQGLLRRVTGRYPGKPVYLITPLWRRNETERKTSGTLADVRKLLTETVASFKTVQVIPGETLVPPLPYLYSDGLHPTDEGFSHYAVQLYRYLTNNME